MQNGCYITSAIQRNYGLSQQNEAALAFARNLSWGQTWQREIFAMGTDLIWNAKSVPIGSSHSKKETFGNGLS